MASLPDVSPVTEAVELGGRQKDIGFLLIFGLACLTVGIGSVLANILFLPAILAHIPQGDFFYSLLVAGGALVTVIVSPLIGRFIDLRGNRTRLWFLLAGAFILAGALFLFVAPFQFFLYIPGELFAQVSAGGMIYIALTTLLPQVSPDQRATLSAFLGVGPLFGGVVGQVLVTQLFQSALLPSALLLGTVSVILVLIFCGFARTANEDRMLPPVPQQGQFARRLLQAFRDADFSWVWVARCLLFLSYTSTINYSALWLGSRQPIFFGPSVLVLIVAAFLMGKLSDRLLRRKVFVIGASVFVAIGLGVCSLNQSTPGLLIAAFFFGAGFGTYQAVDLALASQVLQIGAEGQDLGLMNAAVFLSMVAAPLLAAGTLFLFHSFAALFAVLAIFALIGAGCVLPVKSVR